MRAPGHNKHLMDESKAPTRMEERDRHTDNQPFLFLLGSELVTCEAKCSHKILVVVVQC